MRQQGLRVGITLREFGLAEQSVYLPVTDPVQHAGIASTFRLRHPVVRILLRRRDRPSAQRTQRLNYNCRFWCRCLQTPLDSPVSHGLKRTRADSSRGRIAMAHLT